MNIFNRLFSMFNFSNRKANTSFNTADSNSSSSSTTTTNLSGRKVSELRGMAKTMGLKGYSSMRKSELVSYIEENTAR